MKLRIFFFAMAMIVTNTYSQTIKDEDYYNDCVLKNIKPGMDMTSTASIRKACAHKAVPKRCRDFNSSLFEKELLEDCFFECKKENYWTREFGECSKG